MLIDLENNEIIYIAARFARILVFRDEKLINLTTMN